MVKTKKSGKRFVKQVKFKMKNGQSLVIDLGMPSIGMDRVIVENNDGIVEVMADGHSRFEFSDKKSEPGTCDFRLGQPYYKILLKDYLIASFWGQFGWGGLFKYRNNRALVRKINEEIVKLTEEFEEMAAKRLNGLVGR